jgi:hypothetical protein
MNVHQQQLSSLGIQNSGGGFQINPGLLDSNLQTQPQNVESLFGGTDGIAAKTIFGAKKILYAPMINLSVFTRNVDGTNVLTASGLLLDKSL